MRRAEDRLALFDATVFAMVSSEESARALKGPYVEEANAARAALLEILEADYPDFATERKRRQEAQWADNRRRLKAALGD